jgi:hypothetical protein
MEIGEGEGFKMKFLARKRDFHCEEENRDGRRRRTRIRTRRRTRSRSRRDCC